MFAYDSWMPAQLRLDGIWFWIYKPAHCRFQRKEIIDATKKKETFYTYISTYLFKQVAVVKRT